MFRRHKKTLKRRQIKSRNTVVGAMAIIARVLVAVVLIAAFLAVFADAPLSDSYFTYKTKSSSQTVIIND